MHCGGGEVTEELISLRCGSPLPRFCICITEFDQASSTNIRNLNEDGDGARDVEGGVECTKDFCDLVFETRHEMYVHRDGCIYTCPVCGLIITTNGKAEGHTKKCNAFRGISDI